MKGKTRKQFFDELADLRLRAAELEASEAERQQTVTALKRRVEYLQVLRDIDEAALTEQPLDAIARIALERMKPLVPYQRADVALFDFEARQAKVIAAETGGGTGQGAGAQYALETLGPERMQALERGESILVEDGAEFPLGPKVARALRAEKVPSCLSVPLAAGGAAIGVLNVWAASFGGFAPEHIEVIHQVAAVLATAIQQARRLEQLQRHARELVALYNAAQAMVSVLDLQSVLKTVITEAKTLLGAEVASVLLRSGDTLVFEASVGPGADKLVGTRIPISAGIAGWVMREKRAVRVSDAQQDPRFYTAIDHITGLVTRSVLAAPLIAKGDIRGVIEVINKIEPLEPNSIFYEQDLEILIAMAGPAAVAIENAQSYQASLGRPRGRSLRGPK